MHTYWKCLIALALGILIGWIICHNWPDTLAPTDDPTGPVIDSN